MGAKNGITVDSTGYTALYQEYSLERCGQKKCLEHGRNVPGSPLIQPFSVRSQQIKSFGNIYHTNQQIRTPSSWNGYEMPADRYRLHIYFAIIVMQSNRLTNKYKQFATVEVNFENFEKIFVSPPNWHSARKDSEAISANPITHPWRMHENGLNTFSQTFSRNYIGWFTDSCAFSVESS